MRALTREGSFRPAPGGAIAVLALGGALVFWGWMSPAWGGEAQPGPSAPADQGPSLAEQLENDPILLFRFALRDFQRGLYVRALPLLARFVEKFPDHSEHQRAIYMLADAHFFIATTGVPAEYMNAVAIYQLALQRYPQAPQMPMAYFRMGQAYQAQKRAAEAQVAFRTLLEKAPTSTLAPRAQIEIAKRYVELGDPRSAIVEFEKVLKNYKGSPSEREAHFGIADALFRQGFYPRALEQFESGDKRWPDFLRLHGDHLYNYAETLFQTRRFARAADAYLRMVNIDPSNEFTNRALARLGDLYHREGRREDALKVYSRVLDKYPLSEGGLVSLIRIADMAVEEEVKLPESHIFPLEALRNPLDGYKKVIELAPTHQLAEVALLRIASYHLKRGEIQKAIVTVEEFLVKYPASQLINNAYFLMAKAHFDQVSRFYQRRQFLRAVQTYAVFRSKVPTPVTRQANPYKTMLEVGESYMRLGLYEQAGKMFEEILSEPEGVVAVGDEVLFRFAHAALLTGDRAKAKALATRFVNAFPRSGRLASVRAIQGEIAWVERDPRSAAVLRKNSISALTSILSEVP